MSASVQWKTGLDFERVEIRSRARRCRRRLDSALAHAPSAMVSSESRMAAERAHFKHALNSLRRPRPPGVGIPPPNGGRGWAGVMRGT